MHHSELAKETPAMARFNHDSEAQRALAHTGRLRDIKPEDFDYYFLRGWARPHAGPDRQSRFNRADPVLLNGHCPDRLELCPVGGKQQNLGPCPIFRSPGPPRLATYRLWSRTQQSTPQPVDGVRSI